MGLRITSTVENDAVVLGLHGWLVGEEVEAFRNALLHAARPLSIDLRWLVGADETGVSALREARGAGARLEGASPYLQLLLRVDRDQPRPSGDSS
jgi:hypothetical protein